MNGQYLLVDFLVNLIYQYYLLEQQEYNVFLYLKNISNDNDNGY